MTLTFDLYLTLTLSLTFDLDDLKKYIFFNFFHFLWSHVTQKRDVVRQNGRSHTEAAFYKEHVAANQKSLPLPVQKLWPIMWFSLIFLKSRDVKTWCRTSKRSISHRSGIWYGMFCYQPEVSATSGSKVMAHYLIFTKVVTLTLRFIRFSKKKCCKVLDLEDIFCQKIGTIGQAVWSVHRETTDKQTNRWKGTRRVHTLQNACVLHLWLTLTGRRSKTQSIST